MERAKKDLHHIIRDIDRARDEEFWIRNQDVCYLRERRCPYTRLCKVGMRPQVLMDFDQEDDTHPELDLDNALIPDGEELPE